MRTYKDKRKRYREKGKQRMKKRTYRKNNKNKK